MVQQPTGLVSQNPAREPHRQLIVIVGGGFAAVQFAETLRSKLSPSECDILLFNRENHMVLHPLLADVAGASINLDAAVAPLRQMLPGVECRTQRVVTLDDSTLVATATMMDHGISWLPVVRSKDDLRPVGSIRGDKISYRITKKIAQTEMNYAQIANSIPMVR